MIDKGMGPRGMNSFNHYAYGSVADWIYSVAGGIRRIPEFPGYEKVKIAPVPDERLDWLSVTLDTRHGKSTPVGKRQEMYGGMKSLRRWMLLWLLMEKEQQVTKRNLSVLQ